MQTLSCWPARGVNSQEVIDFLLHVNKRDAPALCTWNLWQLCGSYRDYRDYMGLYRDNGKENGSYYLKGGLPPSGLADQSLPRREAS